LFVPLGYREVKSISLGGAMKKSLVILASMALLMFGSKCIKNRTIKAVCCVPVADAYGFCVSSKCTKDHAFHANSPLCFADNFGKCARVKQLHFNDEVNVIDSCSCCYRVEVPWVAGLNSSGKLEAYRCWVKKNQLLPLSTLKKRGIPVKRMPKQVSFKNKESLFDDNTVVLCEPWDAPDGRAFSAGTRFVVAGKGDGIQTPVWILDDDCKNMRAINVPANIFSKGCKEPLKVRIGQFINLLRSWCQNQDGLIPYVWGGLSIVRRCKIDNIITKKCNNGACNEYFVRSDCARQPQTGVDCSGMILLATHIVGLPYFFGNTTVLERSMESATVVHDGDLIWFPGHVMVVSDAKKNLLIEARGYGAGYGKVHEIPLSEAFEGINSYADLLEACTHKKVINLLNKQGKRRMALKQIRILDLQSALS
jgi:hypothetical protein